MPRRLLLATIILPSLTAAHALGATRFVNANLAGGANTGASWTDAYRGRDGLTRALNDAVAGDDIWVASGICCPAIPVAQGGTGLRTTSFALKNGVAIYGGFSGAGTETQLAERNIALNSVILTGDINNDDLPYPSTTGWGENSIHVVSSGLTSVTDSTAIIDGFTIREGYANVNGNFMDRGGGVIIVNSGTGTGPTLRNLKIINNRVTFGGGGLYINMSSPRLEDCRVESNHGGSFGGGCDTATFCNPVWIRCAVVGNTAARAGGVEVFGTCAAQFINCLFARNTATGNNGGGGLLVATSTATLRNCTIVFNQCTGNGPGSATTGAGVSLFNCIVSGNTGPSQFGNQPTQTYTCIPGGRTDLGNINATPLFVDAATNDFRLAAGSPGVDAGNNADLTADMATDLLGVARRIDDPAAADIGAGDAPFVDMGCYERQPPCRADFNGVGGVTIQDVFDFLVAYFAGSAAADVNGVGGVTVQDVFDYLAVYFAGCA